MGKILGYSILLTLLAIKATVIFAVSVATVCKHRRVRYERVRMEGEESKKEGGGREGE